MTVAIEFRNILFGKRNSTWSGLGTPRRLMETLAHVTGCITRNGKYSITVILNDFFKKAPWNTCLTSSEFVGAGPARGCVCRVALHRPARCQSSHLPACGPETEAAFRSINSVTQPRQTRCTVLVHAHTVCHSLPRRASTVDKFTNGRCTKCMPATVKHACRAQEWNTLMPAASADKTRTAWIPCFTAAIIHPSAEPENDLFDVCDSITGPYWWIDRSHSVQRKRSQNQLHCQRHGTGPLWAKEGKPGACELIRGITQGSFFNQVMKR